MNLEARFFSPEEYDAEQHNNPLEQGMTPVDILRPEDDTCPVSSDSESEGILVFLEDDTSSRSSTRDSSFQMILQFDTSPDLLSAPDSVVVPTEGILVILVFICYFSQFVFLRTLHGSSCRTESA